MTIERLIRPTVYVPLLVVAMYVAPRPSGVLADPAAEGERTATAVGVRGGLCVQIGAGDLSLPTDLAKTGRFLVHVLDDQSGRVEQARRRLSAKGLYGMAIVERLEVAKLPYTENLVNLVVLAERPAVPIAATELNRVLCPRGGVLAVPGAVSATELTRAGFTKVRMLHLGRRWLVGRKPWPAEMDEWTHPRHSASGNPVSNDTVAGPPRRVRWVVAATAEVRGLVSAGGRNFYAAVLARDAFNGLRLWNRDLIDPSSRGRFVMKNLPGNVPAPVAGGQLLFAVSAGKLLALDAATGKTVRQYPDAGQPREVLHDEGLLIVVSGDSVRALEAGSGRLVWRYAAPAARNLVAGDDYVGLVLGNVKRGQKPALTVLNKHTGKPLWTRDDLPWLGQVYRCVYHNGLLACEVSSLNNDGPGNSLHLVSAEDGQVVWQREFPPGMNHMRQARAMFIGDRLWILYGGRVSQDRKLPVHCWALAPGSGDVLAQLGAGLAHCFPPVATPRYLLSGEMNFTDLATGQIDANRITKAACGRDYGWVPANGLVYVTPKHCVCWPMLRGYAALAPARPGGSVADMKPQQIKFPLQKGEPLPAGPAAASSDADDDWPCYRHDAWRSGSTPAAGPADLTTLWSVSLGDWPDGGPIVADWRENPYIKGPVTPPVVAAGRLYVARPDAHQVLALDASTGRPCWRFTANGRVDTPPTLYRGLCLFGAKSGWVYCLRAEDGHLVWRLRAAPLDERIVAYGQLESPWPVPGSVLVVDETAYFAAGRQPFADGGILIFAVEPASGAIRWVRKLDSVPQQGFYESSALEFDNFDLLYRRGDGVAMSRWVFNRADGRMSVDKWRAFAKLNTGGGSAMVPPGCWSYAPRHQRRIASYTPRRPLLVFRDNVLIGCLQGSRTLFRRDFHLEQGEQFNSHWMTGWAAGQMARDGKMPWPNNRLAEKATWRLNLYDPKRENQTVEALAMAGDKLYVVGSGGELRVLSTADGKLVAKCDVPEPLWDGLAVADGRLFLATTDGRVLCLGPAGGG